MTPLRALIAIREQLDRTDVPDPATQLGTISSIIDRVLYDAELLLIRHVTSVPRDYKNPPHHLRCVAISETNDRCILGEGHQADHTWSRNAPG